VRSRRANAPPAMEYGLVTGLHVSAAVHTPETLLALPCVKVAACLVLFGAAVPSREQNPWADQAPPNTAPPVLKPAPSCAKTRFPSRPRVLWLRVACLLAFAACIVLAAVRARGHCRFACHLVVRTLTRFSQNKKAGCSVVAVVCEPNVGKTWMCLACGVWPC
jgi:hypothetical protein